MRGFFVMLLATLAAVMASLAVLVLVGTARADGDDPADVGSTAPDGTGLLDLVIDCDGARLHNPNPDEYTAMVYAWEGDAQIGDQEITVGGGETVEVDIDAGDEWVVQVGPEYVEDIERRPDCDDGDGNDKQIVARAEIEGDSADEGIVEEGEPDDVAIQVYEFTQEEVGEEVYVYAEDDGSGGLTISMDDDNYVDGVYAVFENGEYVGQISFDDGAGTFLGTGDEE